MVKDFYQNEQTVRIYIMKLYSICTDPQPSVLAWSININVQFKNVKKLTKTIYNNVQKIGLRKIEASYVYQGCNYFIKIHKKYYYTLRSPFLFKYILKCNLLLWCKAEFSASLLQSSASHDPLNHSIWFSSKISYHYQCWKLLCCLISLWKPWSIFSGFFDE